MALAMPGMTEVLRLVRRLSMEPDIEPVVSTTMATSTCLMVARPVAMVPLGGVGGSS